MYRTEKNSWLKHIDFILWDLLCVQLAFLLSYTIRHPGQFVYADRIYLQIGFYLFLIQICISFFSQMYEGILRRGLMQELKWTIVMSSFLTVLALILIFLVKWTEDFSRAVILMTWFISIVFIYFERTLWKIFIRKRMHDLDRLRKMVVIADSSEFEFLINQFEKYRYKDFYVSGVILLDQSKKHGEQIHGYPVVAVNRTEAVEYLENVIVDRVFISGMRENDLVQTVFELCQMQGIPVHFDVGHLFLSENKPIVENFCGQSVVTYSINTAAYGRLMLKRLIDIIGSIVGLAITGILTIILAPIIYIQSPGPIFFTQERVGQNGRVFKIHKFRSMYPDAEERLKDLQDQNKMQGPMFKVDNDPRITPIGRFIRKTSLDEFPQFWNVFRGSMSLVGTRAPLVSEYQEYQPHHKVRLSFKPGITGLWQVSGRSNIVNFEEVVKLDKQYITEWSLKLDLKILLKTVKVMFSGEGAE